MAEASPVRLGVIGVGNRGTALLRALLELPGTPIVAVCDAEPKHRQRGQGIVEKARGQRPEAYDDPRRVSGSTGHRRGRRRPSLRPPRTGLSRRDPGRQAPLRRKAAGVDAGRLRSPDRRIGRKLPSWRFTSGSSGGRTRGFARESS